MGAFTSCFSVPADDEASSNNPLTLNPCSCHICFFQSLNNLINIVFRRGHTNYGLASNNSSDGKVDQVTQDDDDVGLDKKSISKQHNIDSHEHKDIEDDECPTCLEEYSEENPKIIAKCCHHFHLSCIYEWMERSDKCPVCSKTMLFDG